MNNFQRYLQEEESHYDERSNVGRNVEHTTGFIGMFSAIVEVYLPRVFDVFVSMNGGSGGAERSGNYAPNRGFDGAPPQ